MRVTSSRLRALVPAACAFAGTAAAHGVPEDPRGAPAGLGDAWTLSAWVLLPLAVLGGSWLWGLVRLWRRAGPGHGVSGREAAAFALGMATLFAATVWPLDAYGEWSLAAHMAQHMALLALAPPLLLAGRPFAVLATAWPRRWSRAMAAVFSRPLDRLLAALVPATGLHLAVMGGWHLPVALRAALASDAVHVAMHGSFLLAGLWFWAAVGRRVRERELGAGAGLVALLAVTMAMGLMGGLLTFSPRVLYADYVVRAPHLGLDPLQDQALAGLLMWVPACLPYLAVALLIASRALRRAAGRRAGEGAR